ncbi:ATP-binding protein [Deferrisoma camini]|uniref:ATP-binding protein n=1 Tax=Deferrisoma camini TaxID=1035120 RepID=UPI00046CB6B2|nr:transporter substrate-binding domain-containing protein [Deferrisoma camini]
MARTRWLVTALLLAGMFACPPAGASDLLTPDERAWLQAHEGQVRWCPIPNYAPIDFVDGDGRPAGLAADYLARIQEMLGFRIRVESCGDWMEILEKLRDRRVDLVAAIEQTPERDEYLAFTRPYITIPVVILTREDLDRDLTLANMAGMHVAVPAGYATVGWVRQNYPEVVVVPTRDDPEALQAVSLGRADAALVDLAVASYFIGRLGITNLRVAGYSGFEWNLRFGVRSDWPELARILDKGLAAIPPDEQEAMQRRWIGLIGKPFYRRPEVWWTSAGVVGAVGLLFALVIVWNRSLSRQVRERTAELEGALARTSRAEADAEAARQILTAVLEGMDALVFVADMETHEVLFANARMREAFGTNPVGRRCWEVFRHRDGPCDHCTNPRLVGPDGEAAPTVVWEGRNPVTGRFYLNCDRAIRWVDGRWVRLETSTDITERKALEARLREAQKMEAVGTLAGGIAHDFNNILAVVLGNAELALGRGPADPELRRRLERILEASERARQVVAQLLAFCRKTEGPRQPVDAARAVADTLVLLRAAIPANVEIEECIDPAAGAVLADPAGLQRVVMNLVTNAYQAVRGSGGRVTVAVEPARRGERDGVLLVVEDDGPGIPEELMPRIFEPYFTTKEVGQGSGLGLAVVRGMVEAMGGTVEVDSRPGRGTRFSVWLPGVQEGAGGAPWPDGGARGAGQRVLVVDDEPAVAEATAAVLEGVGYRTRWTTDPAEALDLVRSGPGEWDLVVTDQTMPGLMGTELCRRIREVRPDLPVVLCTGYSESLDESAAAGVGASALLFKPVASRDLARAVAEALGV